MILDILTGLQKLDESTVTQNVTHTWDLWLSCIVWTIVGIALVKAFTYPHGSTKFSIKFWLANNLKDIIVGILLTLVVVKLGDMVLNLLGFIGIDLSGLEHIFRNEKLGTDPVQLSLIIAVAVQWFLYKRNKSKKVNN